MLWDLGREETGKKRVGDSGGPHGAAALLSELRRTELRLFYS